MNGPTLRQCSLAAGEAVRSCAAAMPATAIRLSANVTIAPRRIPWFAPCAGVNLSSCTEPGEMAFMRAILGIGAAITLLTSCAESQNSIGSLGGAYEAATHCRIMRRFTIPARNKCSSFRRMWTG